MICKSFDDFIPKGIIPEGIIPLARLKICKHWEDEMGEGKSIEGSLLSRLHYGLLIR